MAHSKEIEDLLQKIKESDLSIQKIAIKLDIPSQRIYNWLNKGVNPKYEDVIKLREYFGVSVKVQEPRSVYDSGKEVPVRDQIRAINGMLSVLAGEVASMKSSQTGEPVGSVLLRLQKAAADAALLG